MFIYLKEFYTNLTAFFSNPAGRFVSSIIFLLVILVTRCLLLCFPGFRVSIYCFSITLLLFCWKFRHKVIEKFLNSLSFQYILFFSLEQENALYNCRGIYGYFYLFVYFFGLIHGPASCLFWLGFDFYLWYGFLLLYFLTYLKVKRLFIYPDNDYIPELNLDGSLQFIKNPNDYNWEFVVKIMNSMTQKWMHINVRNRVSYPLSKVSLPNVGVRFMGTVGSSPDLVKDAIKLSKENPGIAGVVAVTGIVAGLAVYSLESRQIDADVQIAKNHDETLIKQAQIQAEASIKQTQIQAEVSIKQAQFQAEISIQRAQIQAETQRELTKSSPPSWFSSWFKKDTLDKDAILDEDILDKAIDDKAKYWESKNPSIKAPSISEEALIFNMAIKKLRSLLEFILS